MNIDDEIKLTENIFNNINKSHNNWTEEHEQILVEWADKAMCYRWLHSKANSQYSMQNAWYTIPVIVISTLTGTANFAQDKIPEEYQQYFVMAIGGFNILAGIITTVQQFLKITQLNESHRVSSISWDKFYRNIKIELAKHPSERLDPSLVINTNKEEFDRLMEISPIIPQSIIDQFKGSFKKTEFFADIVKPEICDVLVSTEKYRNHWFNLENRNKIADEQKKILTLKEIKYKKMREDYYSTVRNFIDNFKVINNREPLDDEIFDNLKDDIDNNVLKYIIKNKFNINSVKNDNNDNDQDMFFESCV